MLAQRQGPDDGPGPPRGRCGRDRRRRDHRGRDGGGGHGRGSEPDDRRRRRARAAAGFQRRPLPPDRRSTRGGLRLGRGGDPGRPRRWLDEHLRDVRQPGTPRRVAGARRGREAAPAGQLLPAGQLSRPEVRRLVRRLPAAPGREPTGADRRRQDLRRQRLDDRDVHDGAPPGPTGLSRRRLLGRRTS